MERLEVRNISMTWFMVCIMTTLCSRFVASPYITPQDETRGRFTHIDDTEEEEEGSTTP